MIEILKGPDRVRKRPAIMFYPLDGRGCLQVLQILLENAVDEALLGHGDEIIVTVLPGNVYEVADRGRGIDIAHWETYFCALGADSDSEKDEQLRKRFGADSYRRYGFHLAAAQFVCQWMEVDTCRNRRRHFLRFEKGYPIRREFFSEPEVATETGTVIRFCPDTEIFSDTTIPQDALEQLLRQTAIAVEDLTLTLRTPGKSAVFSHPHPIPSQKIPDLLWEDTIRETNSEGRSSEPYEVSAGGYFSFTDSPDSYHVHNHLYLTGSLYCTTPEHLGRTLPSVALEQAVGAVAAMWYPGEAFCLTRAGEYLQMCFCTYAERTFFADAGKTAIQSTALERAFLPVLTEALQAFLLRHRPETEHMLQQLLANAD